MISFLVRTNNQGIIEYVYWCNPVYLIAGIKTPLSEIFVPSDKAAVDYLILDVNAENFRAVGVGFETMQRLGKIGLIIEKTHEHQLILGVEESFIFQETNQIEWLSILHLMMEEIISSSCADPEIKQGSVRSQFEEIQTLNNDLINTRRMLEKTNAKLDILNKDLNNRLVKDALIGLISRYQYRTEMEYYINMKPEKFGVFIFMDIDNFKSINDNHGHAAGDQYLVAFAQRLKSMPFKDAIYLRISGDEFGMFAYGLDKPKDSDMQQIWDYIKQYVLYPIEINGLSLSLSVSAGMAVLGVDTSEIYTLIEYADFAMHTSKRKGKNQYGVFNKSEYISSVDSKSIPIE